MRSGLSPLLSLDKCRATLRIGSKPVKGVNGTMSSDYRRFKYSATCYTFDAAVLACLRALCYYSMVHVEEDPQIGYGGSGEEEWEDAGHQATFRFTEPRYRERFIGEANRLLAGHWELMFTSDYDPAKPQRTR